jgi:hypothetical protein
VGKEKTSTIVFGTLSKGGSITTIEDITSRTDLDADGKTVMFKFLDAENQMITAALENPYNRLSVLTNTKKFAPNGKQYTFTYDEADAKANPEKVLIKIDPASGQPTPEFNDEQMNVSNEAMRTEVRAKYNYEKAISATGQAQRQDPPQSVLDAETKKREAENFGRNLGKALKSTNIEERDNAIKYLGQKAGRQVIISGGRIIVRDIDGQGESVYELNANPDELASSLVSAFGVDLPEDTILKFAKSTLKGNKTNITGEATAIVTRPAEVVFEVPENIFTDKSVKSAANLQNLLPSGFTVVDKGYGVVNNVHVYAPGKSEEAGDTPYKYNANLSASEIPAAKAGLEAFINKAKQGEGAFADF